MLDPRATMMPASFRGARFHVEKDEVGSIGRDVVRHKYVKSNKHATEDMGRLVREYRITAYLASDTARADTEALARAFDREGVGTLVLPLQGSAQVRAEKMSTACHKDKLGWVALDLELVEAGEDGAGFPAIPLGDRLTQGALDGLPGAGFDALSSFPAGVP